MPEADYKKPKMIPWVSFCMSTYKRPELLKKQIDCILNQKFTDFNIIISDNDPLGSGKIAVESFNDSRIDYAVNDSNLGMVKSFNKSISRSQSEFIVMITDDDPVYPEMLMELHDLYKSYPGYGFYGGIKRAYSKPSTIEVINSENFVYEILHPKKSQNILWSGCIFKREIVLKNNGFPDYGSPHLADHLMIVVTGAENGGVIINKQFSSLSHHEGNFSKSNLDLYFIGCKKFYEIITNLYPESYYTKNGVNSLKLHLNHWFIGTMFNLKNYYTFHINDKDNVQKVNLLSKKILSLNFMKEARMLYLIKDIKYRIKINIFKLTSIKI